MCDDIFVGARSAGTVAFCGRLPSILQCNPTILWPCGRSRRSRTEARIPSHSEIILHRFQEAARDKSGDVFLPNGISTIFGPVSARRSDIPVLQMSNLNEFLVGIQIHNQLEYSALGDSAYHVNLRCICSYFKRYAGQQPLTHHERRCNKAIKKARESIEYSYGLLSELFHITACPSEYNSSPLPGQKHLSWIVD
eukprot:scaffold20320_cov112-Skeletonema_dohrnii-CCMP3373.AAC.6